MYGDKPYTIKNPLEYRTKCLNSGTAEGNLIGVVDQGTEFMVMGSGTGTETPPPPPPDSVTVNTIAPIYVETTGDNDGEYFVINILDIMTNSGVDTVFGSELVIKNNSSENIANMIIAQNGMEIMTTVIRTNETQKYNLGLTKNTTITVSGNISYIHTLNGLKSTVIQTTV
jgi:hypothetical protein